MKMDTSLLQSDPESLDKIPMKYQDNNQVSFVIWVQKNIQYHRFVQIIKLILYLQLIFATAVIGCIALSNYYSSQTLNDNPQNRLTSATNRNGGVSRIDLDTVRGEQTPWGTKETDMIVSTEPSKNPTEAAKFVVMVEDFDGVEEPKSSGKITFDVNGDNENQIVSDLSKIEGVLDNLDRQVKLPVPNLMDVISSSKIDDMSSSSSLVQKKYSPNVHSMNDVLSSDEDNISTFSDDLGDDRILQLIEELFSKQANSEESDSSIDSKSWADEIPSINRKSKRSAGSSSSESSSSSSSSESGNSEKPPNDRAAVIEMLTEILSKMDKSDCDENSNENVTSNGDHANRARSLRKRLAANILKAPMPDCGALQPSLAVDKCGNVSYTCPLSEVGNERSEKHTG